MSKHRSREDIIIKAHTEMILGGYYKPGEQIRSVRVLAKRYGVSQLTVSYAISHMISAGLLYSKAGKGVFVSDNYAEINLEKGQFIGLADLREDRTPVPGYVKENLNLTRQLEAICPRIGEKSVKIQGLSYKKKKLLTENSEVKLALEQGKLAGLIVIGWIEPEEIDQLHNHNIPVVVCNHLVPEREIPTVCVNWKVGVRKLLERLPQNRRKRIEMITYSQEWVMKNEHGLGYLDAARYLGISSFSHENIHVIDNTEGLQPLSVYDNLVSEVLKKKPLAILSFDDVIADRVCVLARKNRYRIPENLSLASIHYGVESSGRRGYKLVALNSRAAYRDVIFEAFSAMERCICGQMLTGEKIMVTPTIIEGDSISLKSQEDTNEYRQNIQADSGW